MLVNNYDGIESYRQHAITTIIKLIITVEQTYGKDGIFFIQ